jgi:hypothetical protein
MTMVTHEWLADAFTGLMSQYPLVDRGMIWFFTSPSFEGVTFKLLDATGKPYYVDEERNLSGELEATTSFSQGGFVDVIPGEVRIEIGGTANRCAPTWAWPGDADDRFRIPVRAGYMTLAGVRCQLPQ